MLHPPPKDLSGQVLPTREIGADALFRISRYSSGEPFFGRSAANRFDHRHKQKGKRFGTCYCGFDLETAIAETLLHDEIPKRGRFHLSCSDFASRHLVRFLHPARLIVADLTGINLKRLGGNAAISSITPYDLPQQWSAAVHRHPQEVDGLLYISRHLNDRLAVVFYDRAGKKLSSVRYTPLPVVPGILNTTAALGILLDRP